MTMLEWAKNELAERKRAYRQTILKNRLDRGRCVRCGRPNPEWDPQTGGKRTCARCRALTRARTYLSRAIKRAERLDTPESWELVRTRQEELDALLEDRPALLEDRPAGASE